MKLKRIILLFIALGCFFTLDVQGAKHKKINKILILGNSIVAHESSPDIGWTGTWGMAASCRDSDFVHVLTRMIHAKDNHAVVKSRNIAAFEFKYATYNLEELKSLQDFRPDMIIVKISENIDDNTTLNYDFIGHYKLLLKYIDPKNQAVKIIVDGFWPKPNANKVIKQVATDGGYDFVSITSLFNDATNTAKGRFTNGAVANHPSDKGMRNIALRIWNSISKYFPQN